MASPVRHEVRAADCEPALRALKSWTPPDVPGGGVHPGDIGWHLRFSSATVLFWTSGGEPVAVGFSDGEVLRVTVGPGADLGAGLSEDAVDGFPVPVALYRSAGFTVVRENRDWVRPPTA